MNFQHKIYKLIGDVYIFVYLPLFELMYAIFTLLNCKPLSFVFVEIRLNYCILSDINVISFPFYTIYDFLLQTQKYTAVSCAGFELTTLVVIGTDYIGSCESNYHTIMAKTVPRKEGKNNLDHCCYKCTLCFSTTGPL